MTVKSLKLKKILAVILSAVIVISLICGSALAEGIIVGDSAKKKFSYTYNKAELDVNAEIYVSDDVIAIESLNSEISADVSAAVHNWAQYNTFTVTATVDNDGKFCDEDNETVDAFKLNLVNGKYEITTTDGSAVKSEDCGLVVKASLEDATALAKLTDGATYTAGITIKAAFSGEGVKKSEDTEEQKTEEQKTEETAPETPAEQSPVEVVEEPAVEEPAVEEPAVEEPVPAESAKEESEKEPAEEEIDLKTPLIVTPNLHKYDEQDGNE